MRGIAAIKPGAHHRRHRRRDPDLCRGAAHERGARLLRPRPRPAVPRRAEHRACRPCRAKASCCKPGMFFTVEPMINLGRPHVKVLSDGWTAVTRDRSLSAQFEHTVGVTENGVEIFTLSPQGPRTSRPTTRAAPMECMLRRRRHWPATSMAGRSRERPTRLKRHAPHYHGHRERLRKRFREAGATRSATTNCSSSCCSAPFRGAT